MSRSDSTKAVLLPVLVLVLMGAETAVKAQVAEQRAIEGDRFMSRSRQLTFEGRRNGEAYFSPDAGKLIFSGEREPENPFFQIYILDLVTGDSWRVSPGRGMTTCSYFQPASLRVLFASSHLDPDADAKVQAELERRKTQGHSRYLGWNYNPHYDIFSSNRDGSDLRRLTDTPGYDAEGTYSNNGRMIVFCSMRDAFPLDKLTPEQRRAFDAKPENFAELYLMNADGTEPRRLTDWWGYDGGPFFSPDDTRIVWRHFDEGGMLADVYTMNVEGTDRRRLTDFSSMSWAPFYHPSGDYVVFTTNKNGFDNFELYLVDAEGRGEPVRVTHTPNFDGMAAFSPDGKTICWTSTRTSNGLSQLFTAKWNHEAALAAVREAPARAETGD